MAHPYPLYEAVGMAGNARGLWVDMLEMDKFIRANGLENSFCTDPIFLDRGTFTPRGVLSNEIFGTSQDERKNRFGIIDLHGPYMYPLAAVKLASYDRRLADCLYARKTFKLTKEGDLVEDPDGNSGPAFLYSIWGKVKVKDKTTETTKEIQAFFERPREKLFLTKYPVIPAFYRDINQTEFSSSKGSSIINSTYSSIISYTQTLSQFTDTFGNMTRLTQARVQTLLVDIYNSLMVQTVKGQPSKFGMLRKSMAGKNLPYTTRLVLTASNLNVPSLSQLQTKFGYATIPLHYVCSMFMPFMVHDLKAYFDAHFIQGGTNDGYTFRESYDENQITSMIVKFVNSPNTRFDKILSPPDVDGKQGEIILEGRFNKDNTTFRRPATYMDIMYIVAERMARDKHVFITRYPMDNINGQNPYRIIISTTTRVEPVTIGETVYQFYPIIKGDPVNMCMTTAQISNPMIMSMGADFDGKTIAPTYRNVG